MPGYFGNWNAIYRRFNEWSFKGKLLNIFQSLVQDPDLEWVFIDGSIVKAHQHSSGAAHEQEAAIGKSRGGNTSKIHLAVDSFGLPIDFKISAGNINDCTMAPTLIAGLPISEYLIADKGYDSDVLRKQVDDSGIIPVIPRKKNSLIGNNNLDWCLYKYRHLVENAFARLKHFRAIATRYDKLKRNYEGMLALACALVWLPL